MDMPAPPPASDRSGRGGARWVWALPAIVSLVFHAGLAGTLLIDLIEAKGFKVRRRDYATRPILRDLPDDARAARIQEVVDEILRNARIGP